MNDPESVRRWLAKAENDLLNIRNNLSAAEVPWDTVCFHAQQTAERLLKTF
ncbi:HEPN domain-containing protein [Thermodesulfobacteriota bacterium]